MLYKLTRKELKNKGAFQFKEGDVIKTGKYYIYIKYGNYSIPSLNTTVGTEDNLLDLPTHKWPYYVSGFISRSPEEIKELV